MSVCFKTVCRLFVGRGKVLRGEGLFWQCPQFHFAGLHKGNLELHMEVYEKTLFEARIYCFALQSKVFEWNPIRLSQTPILGGSSFFERLRM